MDCEDKNPNQIKSRELKDINLGWSSEQKISSQMESQDDKANEIPPVNNENKSSCDMPQELSDDRNKHEYSIEANIALRQGQIEENQTVISPALPSVQQTILEKIDAEYSVFQTKKTDNVNNSLLSVPETKINSDDLSLEASCSCQDNKKERDKENTTFVDTISGLSPSSQCLKSGATNDGIKHQEKHSSSPKTDNLQPDGEIVQRKSDPFSLSADEEFSPKIYKPIQRRLSSVCQEKPVLDLKRSAPENCSDEISNMNHTSSEVLLSNSVTLSDSFPERKKMKPSHRVTYIHSPEMVEKANRLSRIKGRANLIHSLIEVYGILGYIDVLTPRYATEAEILGFHCPDYVQFLKGISDDDDDNSEAIIDEAEEYGLSYDCPLQKDCFDIASLISGGTITAAEALCGDKADIAINWCGGWHHAKRDSASGFCYLNDIVLGILKLRESFDKVLYIDLDLHHGDGVQEAFYMTPKVMTVSFHKYAPGFFPGSGNVDDVGTGRGKYFSVNVPLMDGIKNKEFYFIFTSVMKAVKEKFQPEAVVIQCGADTLAEDPMLSFNMTHVAVARCVCFVFTWNLPVLLLGGGGYHFASTAKCWTFITAMAAGKKLPMDIPEHEHLPEYGPSYELTTSPGNRKNCNSLEYLRQTLVKVHRNLNKMETMVLYKIGRMVSSKPYDI